VEPAAVAGYLAHARTAAHQRRLAEARAIIAQALAASRRPYIAFSTGKDSLVLAHLVWEQAPATPAVYFDARCAFPESLALLDRLAAAGRPIERWPCQDFLDLLAAAGGPDAPGIEQATMAGTVYRPVRALLAARGYDAVFLGLRGAESPARSLLVRTRGLLFSRATDGLLECLPLGRWSDRDVWAAIFAGGLDYNRAYDRMADLPPAQRRLSYWAGETSRRYGRWVWLRRHYPALWARFVQRFPEVARFT
jgi:3'-phosphoadenosine 5'-phosphosulfate sulfotransferase (PAPS reductase)/FAD synthetase